MTAPASRRFLQAGLSMVELMVAMVIALIGTIIMFQVFEVSEGIKRSTSSGGDSQQNGVVALYVMENDLRQAGMGFSDTGFAGCNILAYDALRTPQNFTLQLVPVSITSGGAVQTPDRFTVFYGSQHMVGGATSLSQNMVTATTQLRVLNRFGYRAGDLLVLMEPSSGKNCAMMEVTSLPGGDFIAHDTGTYTLDWMGGTPPSKTVRANPGGGLGVIYTGAGSANATRIFNLGNLYDRNGTYAYNGASMPVNNTYAVATTTLTVSSAFNPNQAGAVSAVADNIVHMRALYALDDGVSDASVPYQTGAVVAGDGKIDRFVDAAKFAAAGSPWQRIVAMRVVVVARSAQPERGSGGPGSACDTTVAAPTWSASSWPVGLALMTSLDLSADADWRCYSYKTFETTVPVRNWIWKSS